MYICINNNSIIEKSVDFYWMEFGKKLHITPQRRTNFTNLSTVVKNSHDIPNYMYTYSQHNSQQVIVRYTYLTLNFFVLWQTTLVKRVKTAKLHTSIWKIFLWYWHWTLCMTLPQESRYFVKVTKGILKKK